MKGGMIRRSRRVNGQTRYYSMGISQVTDDYIIEALRGMEARADDEPDGYVGECAVADHFVDVGELENYEMLKAEAETRGLIWRRD